MPEGSPEIGKGNSGWVPSSRVNVFNENDDIVVVISEVNAIQGKISSWWYDTCAAVHVCYDKSFFKTYKEVNDGQ